MNNLPDKTAASIAQRKAQLVAEGAAYRSKICIAAESVQVSLGAESLAKNALTAIATIGFGLLKGRASFGGIGLQTFLPLLMGGFSALSKKVAPKPLLRITLIVGAVATSVGLLIKKIKSGNKAKPKKGS